MSLVPGTRVGVFEILSLIGRGGMGEVYKATDTNLKRAVALKVLPESVAADAGRLARFQREAEILGALNHANIAHIHGLEKSGGVIALVMELIEGEDLSQRLARAALPTDDALPIAKQIAEALEAAHEQGIIHRDLKPANIKVRSDGQVKVLDFGLAKALEPAGAMSANLSMSPTLTTPAMTEAGMVLGTPAYMSPEQARGGAADKRADIWAFGCVLFEMLTGRPAFAGGTVTDVLAAVLKNEPDWTTLPASTPPPIRRLLRRCLEKDRKGRLADAADARLDIEEAVAGGSVGTAAPTGPPQGGAARERLSVGVAAAALAAVAVLLVLGAYHPIESAPDPVRFEVRTASTDDPPSFALSPDGRQLAFVAIAEGAPRLWVRPLDQVAARSLQGTEGASFPFWAPDSDAIGFFANGKLKRIDLAGGPPVVLADAVTGTGSRGGTWNREGVIVFQPVFNRPLMRVAATGGTPVALAQLPAGWDPSWPQFLPDGRRFLFSSTRGVYMGGLDGGEPTQVLPDATSAVFAAPSSLLLVRQGVLVEFPFDPKHGVITGDPVPVAQGVGLDAERNRGMFTVSTTGVLAHRAGGLRPRQLVWLDRAGTIQGTLGPADENNLNTPELAPDGRRVAVRRTVQGNTDVWLIEVGRGVQSRFTFDAGFDDAPLWSPDGRRVVFNSNRNGGPFELFEKPASGVGDEQSVPATADSKVAQSWSSDGRLLLYRLGDPKTGNDLWALPMTGAAAERKPFPVLRMPFDETSAQFSPDGRWIAYQSNESGPVEIYVRLFPGPGGLRQVSVAGGTQPRWRPDGKELFYIAPDNRLMAAPITVGADRQTLEVGAPVALFATRLVAPPGGSRKQQYAVAPDGRFLMNVMVDEATPSPITVVLNWRAGLRK